MQHLAHHPGYAVAVPNSDGTESRHNLDDYASWSGFTVTIATQCESR